MAYTSNAFKVLADMPTKLSKKNLEVLQAEIDKEKLAYSIEMNRDLCGDYAPFCSCCEKNSPYPCALALIKYKQADGVYFEIAAADDSEAGDDVPDVSEAITAETDSETDSPAQDINDTVTEEVKTESLSFVPEGELKVGEENAESAENAEPAPEPVKEKKVIRIAVAKRKHN